MDPVNHDWHVDGLGRHLAGGPHGLIGGVGVVAQDAVPRLVADSAVCREGVVAGVAVGVIELDGMGSHWGGVG